MTLTKMTDAAAALFIMSQFPTIARVIRATATKSGARKIADADVDDLCSMTMEKALKAGIEVPRADDPQASEARGFLLSIAHNATVDFLKSHGTRVAYRGVRVHSVDATDSEESTDDGVSEVLPGTAYVSAERRMMAREVLLAVYAAVETLPPADKSLARAFISDPEGFNADDYAAGEGFPATANAIRIRLCRVRKVLQSAAV